VMDEFDLLFRYWLLRAKYDAVGSPLTEAERTELLSLVQQAASEREASDPQEAERACRSLPVKLTAGGGFSAGELRQMAPELLVVAAAEHLDPGTRTVVTLADAISGVEYSLPCVVRWAKRSAPCLLGLSIAGPPTKSAFAVSATGRVQIAFGLGKRDRSLVA
jgi:hypothetical protein